MQARADLIVERLETTDVVAFAECAAIDVTVFPHPSIPGLEAFPAIWIARGAPGGAVAGFVVATRRGHLLEIRGLAVSPALRRRGVGRALLRAAVAAAAGSRSFLAVLLQVSSANRAALALYEDEGFVRVRRLPGYYARRGGGDAWAMMRPLR
jgi:ribosomal protein S18 acetylase RimI-like enzyme